MCMLHGFAISSGGVSHRISDHAPPSTHKSRANPKQVGGIRTWNHWTPLTQNDTTQVHHTHTFQATVTKLSHHRQHNGTTVVSVEETRTGKSICRDLTRRSGSTHTHFEMVLHGNTNFRQKTKNQNSVRPFRVPTEDKQQLNRQHSLRVDRKCCMAHSFARQQTQI